MYNKTSYLSAVKNYYFFMWSIGLFPSPRMEYDVGPFQCIYEIMYHAR